MIKTFERKLQEYMGDFRLEKPFLKSLGPQFEKSKFESMFDRRYSKQN